MATETEREKAREQARERKRRQRERERRGLVAISSDDEPDDLGSEHMLPAGIIDPPQSGDDQTGAEFSGDLMREQARWVYERRLLTIIERKRRLGELIQVDEARAQSAALARRIRAALDRASSHLPADLSPDHRAICVSALAAAIKQAVAAL